MSIADITLEELTMRLHRQMVLNSKDDIATWHYTTVCTWSSATLTTAARKANKLLGIKPRSQRLARIRNALVLEERYG